MKGGEIILDNNEEWNQLDLEDFLEATVTPEYTYAHKLLLTIEYHYGKVVHFVWNSEFLADRKFDVNKFIEGIPNSEVLDDKTTVNKKTNQKVHNVRVRVDTPATQITGYEIQMFLDLERELQLKLLSIKSSSPSNISKADEKLLNDISTNQPEISKVLNYLSGN